MPNMLKHIVLLAVIAGLLMMVFNSFIEQRQQSSHITYSQFINAVQAGNVRSVEIDADNRTISGTYYSNDSFVTFNPGDAGLVNDLLANKVEIRTQEEKKPSLLLDIFTSWFPMLLLIGLWVFFMRQMQGGMGGRGALSFGKSKARMMSENQIKVTFKDVAGIEEAKEEVKELVEYLKDPSKFQKLGGRIPRGVLMIGPPGTGKTLLARAIAGEAEAPFFSISGSDFVEMFVGVGASRVRDMFVQAKKNSPCIIFIDEIDAVGRHRGTGLGGGHDEREQTLNQLLVEMDGFEANESIIVIAATNRPDVLDPALLRPGRFDRQVTVPLPDVRGREQILKVHMRKVPCHKDVRSDLLARGTPGFSGADLSNLVNEAALFAARLNQQAVGMADFEKAKDKIMMGAERKSMVMSEEEKKLTAYHEAGHAIVGRLVPEHDMVYKVTIIPRGRALGVTMFLPETDKLSHSKRKLSSQLCSLFGGRVAEEIIFGVDAVTTGASNDIERATDIARNMVTRWGLSDKVGPLSYKEEEDHPFLGSALSHTSVSISDETTQLIDQEVRRIIDESYQRAHTLLTDNISKLHTMAGALMKYETLDSQQIDDIMVGKEPRPPEDWSDSDDSKKPADKQPGIDDSHAEQPASEDSVADPVSQH